MHQTRRLALLVGLALATQFPLAGCGQNWTPAEHVSKAREFVDKGDLQSASIELANALQKDPNTVEARWLMANVALQLGDAPRAERDARKAIELGLPRTTGQLTLVKALLLQQEAEKVLTETSLIPDDTPREEKAILLGLRGQAQILNGEAELARPALEQALQIDPRAVTALVGMAIVHASERKYDEARPWVQRALEADPASPEAWSVLGELELAQGKPADAETAFSNVIKYRKHLSVDRARRALARVQLEKFKEAEADIEALKAKGWKNHPYVNYVAGLIFFRQGKYDEAGTAFEISHGADPSFLPTRMYLAITRLLQGRPEQALIHAQYLHAQAPRSPEATRLLSAVQISRAEFAAAKDVLRASLRNTPDDRSTLRMLTTVSLLEGDGARGLEYANKLVSLEPGSRDARDLLMTAKLVAGEKLEADGGKGNAAEANDYTRSLLLALSAFQTKRITEALERAKELHRQYPDKVDPLNLMAACYLVGGQWSQAKVELEKALALQPNEPSATRNLAQIEAQNGDLKRARTLLEGLLKERPDDEQAALVLAEVVVRSGDLAGGMGVLEQVIENNPKALTARTKLAGEYLRAGDTTKVIELTRDLATAQLQERPALLELRGKAQLQSGDLAAARGTFEQWTRLAPDSAPARFHYGDSLARSGDSARARKELEQAVRLDANYLPARVGEVKMLVQANEMKKARQALAKLRTDFGERPEVLGIEGWFALGTGDAATAEERLAASLKARPDSETTILLARALHAQKKHQQSFDLMQNWLQNRPRDLTVLFQLAGGYLSLNRDDEAIATYARVIEHYPNHVPALNNLAWLNRDKEPKKAMEYAKRARQLAPSDPYVLDTLGILTLNEGDVERAYGLLREAAQRAPDDPQIQFHLGSILVKQKRHAEAREVLAKLVKQAPDTQPGQEGRRLLQSIERPQ